MMPDTTQEILQRLQTIEILLDSLTRAMGKTRIDPAFLSLDQAAAMSGKSKIAVQRLLQRNRDNPRGLKVRQIRGGVHRQDFQNFLEAMAHRRPGRGEQIRRAVKEVTS